VNLIKIATDYIKQFGELNKNWIKDKLISIHQKLN